MGILILMLCVSASIVLAYLTIIAVISVIEVAVDRQRLRHARDIAGPHIGALYHG